MGWCHEFGPDISHECGHPMTAGASHCYCEVCGVTCEGKFAGCAEVWARGPKDTSMIGPKPVRLERVRAGATLEAVADTDEAADLHTVAAPEGDAEWAPSRAL